MHVCEAFALQGNVERTVRCKCSFLEIYNETLTDLLSPSEGQHLQIREDANHGIYVENLCEEAVSSSECPSDLEATLSVELLQLQTL